MSTRDRILAFIGDVGEFFLFTLIVGGLVITERCTRPARIAAARAPRRRERINLGELAYRLEWIARYGRERMSFGLYRVAWAARYLRGRAGILLYRIAWLFWYVRDGVRVRGVRFAHTMTWLFWHVRDAVRVRWAALIQRSALREEDRRSRLPYGHY